MLTAYDYTTAKIIDSSNIDIILVGDSASNVIAGHETTLPITLDEMIYHAKSVIRAVKRSLVVVDLPFGSYQGNSKKALSSAIRVMKESGAHAIKMEGGSEILDSVEDPSKIVCDTRSPDEYAGKDVRADRGGHIPGSENINWVNAVDESGKFLSAKDLEAIYESKGIKTDKAVYTLCQTAVRATHTWFVLQELLGYDNVKVYDGSWIEWGNSDLPIETK